MSIHYNPQNGNGRGKSNRKKVKTLLITLSVMIVLLIGSVAAYVLLNFDKISGDLGFDPNAIETDETTRTLRACLR